MKKIKPIHIAYVVLFAGVALLAFFIICSKPEKTENEYPAGWEGERP